MLNRRHLRVKVLQTLYAYTQSPDKQVSKFEKQLLKNVDQVYETYIWLLVLLADVCAYADVDAEDRANKFLPTEKDLNSNNRLSENRFIQLLNQNEQFQEGQKKYKVSWAFDPEIVPSIFKALKQSPEYETYMEDADHSLSKEKDIIKFIFRKLILKIPAVEQAFEERFLHWPMDKEVLKAMVAKTLKNFSSENPAQNKLVPVSPNWEEDKAFVLKLFTSVIQHADTYQELISARTKNWTSDRIALMDTLLMRLAICELIQFPNIPVKVTINEYLEISKEFSTPKSNTFINGILDGILLDLKSAGRIHKHGRGLLE